MILPEWLGGGKRLTAAEVKRLPEGSRVQVISADRHGEKQWKNCTVVKYGTSGKRLRVEGMLNSENSLLYIRDKMNEAYMEGWK